ncbi:MAG: 23S rRNA (cytidine1920-2'-O)/16S rRNA (cytidine1409-2'-O)-methyltransferase [Candidatus Marinamargulisbacteria bacterium]|jgi:23S rRNA (cytidine1920-2'-O)/16S rRNA (cytidine1409-2'-O)-methyltransferase
MSKSRLDEYLLNHHLADSLRTAQALIMSGKVFVNDQKIDKCGSPVPRNPIITISKKKSAYVSRAGEKLAGAMASFRISPKGVIALDIGISTGGFTDFLLQNKASFVIGVDVSYGLTDYKIRSHEKTLLIERTNARNLSREVILDALIKGKNPPDLFDKISLVVMDVSFISVRKILPNLLEIGLKAQTYVVLIKPQFEAPKSWVDDGGVIKSPEKRAEIIEQVKSDLSPHFNIIDTCPAPIAGKKGNQEYFFLLKPKLLAGQENTE